MKALVSGFPSIYGRGRFGPQGMGQDDDSEDSIETDYTGMVTGTGATCLNASCSQTSDVSGWSSITGSTATNTGSTNTTNGTTSTPVSTNAVTSAVSAISSAFTNIFKAIQPVPTGCTSVNTVYGSSVQCVAPGQTPTLSTSLTSLGASLGASGPLILVGGGVVVLLLLMNKK